LQASGLVSLPAVLAFERRDVRPPDVAPANAHCTMERRCTAPSAPIADPCRLVCVADGNALSWGVGLLPEAPSVATCDVWAPLGAEHVHQVAIIARVPATPPPKR
jgi:hypothetical protein